MNFGNHKPASAVQSTAVATPIPFRQNGPGGEQVFGALLACVILLALTYVFLRIAKQRGWLERWGVQSSATTAPASGAITILQQKRLSQKTALFVIRHGASDYILAESANGVSLLDKIPAEQPKDEG